MLLYKITLSLSDIQAFKYLGPLEWFNRDRDRYVGFCSTLASMIAAIKIRGELLFILVPNIVCNPCLVPTQCYRVRRYMLFSTNWKMRCPYTKRIRDRVTGPVSWAWYPIIGLSTTSAAEITSHPRTNTGNIQLETEWWTIAFHQHSGGGYPPET